MNIIDNINNNKASMYTCPIQDNELLALRNLITEGLGTNEPFHKAVLKENIDEIRLNKLSNSIKNELQAKFKKIITPIVKRLIPDGYLEINEDKIRPSLQPKYIWGVEDENYARHTYHDENGIFYEKKDAYNFSFPTRPHQDLSNNGFRSSNVLIFYFQLTDIDKGTSDLEVADFISKKGLLNNSNQWGYHNQFTNEIDMNLNWYKPKDLKPGRVLVMNSLTPHKSSISSNKIRIAVNTKIQPDRLNYLFSKYENDQIKSISNKSIKDKLLYLKEIISDKVKKNKQLLFELSIINFLLNENNLAYDNLKELCLYDVNIEDMNKIIVAAFQKKALAEIKSNDIEEVIIKKKWVKDSCVHTIFNTFN